MAPATDVDLVRHGAQKGFAVKEGLGRKGHQLLDSTQRAKTIEVSINGESILRQASEMQKGGRAAFACHTTAGYKVSASSMP